MCIKTIFLTFLESRKSVFICVWWICDLGIGAGINFYLIISFQSNTRLNPNNLPVESNIATEVSVPPRGQHKPGPGELQTAH